MNSLRSPLIFLFAFLRYLPFWVHIIAGYYLLDTVVGGTYGDNCMLLDSYKDADCQDPETLPEEFKKKPLVLVAHDLVFKTNNKNRKTLLWFDY